MDLLVDEMTLDEIVTLQPEELTKYLLDHGRCRFKDPELIAKTLQKALRDSYRLDKVMAESVNAILAVYANEIRALQRMIKDLDVAIERLVKALPEYQILRSIPSIGPVYAAGILAEIGQIDRFKTEAKLAMYAGLTWKRNDSGDKTGSNTPLLRTGDAYLRYYLVKAANQIRRRDPVFNEYYTRKYQEVKRTPIKRALVLTARKLIRVIFFLLTNHQLYQVKGKLV